MYNRLSHLLLMRDEIEELRINNQHAPAVDSVSSDNEVKGDQLVEQVPGLVTLSDESSKCTVV